MLLSGRRPSLPMLAATLLQAWLQLLGITAGYHRLWSHRAYSACVPLRVWLAIIGLQAFQGAAHCRQATHSAAADCSRTRC